jgi:fatty acid desaturase
MDRIETAFPDTPEVEGTRVTRETLRRLGERRDQPAAGRLCIQLSVLVASLAITACLGASGNTAWVLSAVIAGMAVLSFFPLLHESGHQTAFATPFLNEFGVWLGALVMGQAPTFFREFHWEHHRSTQDRDTDPEISAMPSLLDGWPTNPFTYLFLVSGQFLLLGKLGFTLLCALTPQAIWLPQFPFVRDSRRQRLVWESRLAAVLIAAFVFGGLQLVPGFAYALIAWPIAHLFLGLYLMAEHTGLPNEGSQLERTRSVRSNVALRWLMWNMPYHSEHHAYPGIPFHALPALNQEVRGEILHSESGYLHFQLGALRRAFHLHDSSKRDDRPPTETT